MAGCDDIDDNQLRCCSGLCVLLVRTRLYSRCVTAHASRSARTLNAYEFPLRQKPQLPLCSFAHVMTITICSLLLLIIWSITQLAANHSGVIIIPVVITNCTPLGLIHTDLHSPFIWSRAIYQTNFTIITLS